MQVVLGGVSDRTVALQRGPSGFASGGVGLGLRHRRMDRGVGIAGRDRCRSPVHERAGELERDARVGQVVLHGLEGSDRDAELLAFSHVVGGHFQHAVCQPALLGCDSADTTVVRGHDLHTVDRRSRSRHFEEPAGAVDGGTGSERHVRALAAALGGEDGVGGVGPGDPVLARGNREVGPPEERYAPGRGLHDRFRHRESSGLFEHEHEVDKREPEPSCRLRGEHADHAHGGELIPETGHTAGGVRPRGAHVRRRAFVDEEVAGRVADRELLFGEGEVHGCYFRGRPRTRSAITLRWISLVPA